MKNEKLTGYELSRNWFDFVFENPDKVNPNHTALYFFIIEHCNRLGWSEKIALPCHTAMAGMGCKSYNTYKKTFEDLITFGAIELIQRSTNQYTANIIALLKFDKALNKALDKAMQKHLTKQMKSTVQSTCNIDKHINNTKTNKQLNLETNKQIQGDDFEILETLNTEKPKEKSTPKKEKVIMPFSGDFQELWDKWKNYKRLDHKFNYKSLESEQAAINSLVDLANGNEENAKLIIMQSLANGWKGFFKLKNEQPGFGGFTEQQLRDIYSPIPQ